MDHFNVSPIMIASFFTLGVLFLNGCEPKQVRDFSFEDETNSTDIARNFQVVLPQILPEAKTAEVKLVLAPNLKLSYTDPLDLPNGTINVAGSDTLSPVTATIISDFYDEGFSGKMSMSQSYTGFGIAAMCRGENVHIVNASRLMKPSERALCDDNGVRPITLKVGYDPFVIITHEDNNWLNAVRRIDLELLFQAQTWSDIAPNMPEREINYYFPSRSSGAMSAMSEFVFGDAEADTIRTINGSKFYPYNLELTRDLAEDVDGLGFASFGKLKQLKRLRIKTVSIDGQVPVDSGGRYPISRSLYLITNQNALRRMDVQSFLAFYFNGLHVAMPPEGFAPIDGRDAKIERDRLVGAIRSVTEDKASITVDYAHN